MKLKSTRCSTGHGTGTIQQTPLGRSRMLTRVSRVRDARQRKAMVRLIVGSNETEKGTHPPTIDPSRAGEQRAKGWRRE